jgi:hypothetical protein
VKSFFVALVATCFFGLAGVAQAGPILYAGDLTHGSAQAGLVLDDSVGNVDSYQFWRFDALAGDQIEVIARRQELQHDPVMRIWFGLFGDTRQLGRSQYFADDEIAAPGPYGDPRERFIAQTGTYTIAIYDHSAGGSTCAGLCDYQVSVTGSTATVAEPPALAVLSLGLISLGALRARRRRLT